VTRAHFDDTGALTPPLDEGEALCCSACRIVVEPHQVDDDVGQTIREAGQVVCFACQSTDGFERMVHPQARRKVAHRWGEAVADAGWTPIPSLLIGHACDLGLTPTDLALIVALESHYYGCGDPAVYPSKKRLARLVGCAESTVRARLKHLELGGLIEVHTRRRANASQTANGYTRDGLLRALGLIAGNRAAGRPKPNGLPELLDTLAAEGRHRYRLRCRVEAWQRNSDRAGRRAA
jgi:hypothetical protein